MNVTIPAGALIATGLCTGACLLALDDECDCRCTGRYHAALTDTSVAVDPSWQPVRTAPGDEPERTALTDVLDTLGDTERMHSDQLCTLLAERWPADYPDWTPVMLTRALLEVGLRTRQTWAERPEGQMTNRSGVHRGDVTAAIRRAKRAAS